MSIKYPRQAVYDALNGERDYQDSMWGGAAHDHQTTVGDFLTYMRVYLNQADMCQTKMVGSVVALHQVRKVAALAVACMEYNGVHTRGEQGDVQ